MFHLTHPDQVDALPAIYTDWAIHFDLVEQSAADEREAKRLGG